MKLQRIYSRDPFLIGVIIAMSAQPSPKGEGIFLWRFTPSAFGTSPCEAPCGQFRQFIVWLIQKALPCRIWGRMGGGGFMLYF